MSVTEILQKSWNTIKSQPWFWVKISIALFLPFFLYQITILGLMWNVQSSVMGGMVNGVPLSSTISSVLWTYPIFIIGAWAFSVFVRVLVIEGVGALGDSERASLRETLRRGLSKITKLLRIDLILIGPFALIYLGVMFVMFRSMLPMFDAVFSPEFFGAMGEIGAQPDDIQLPPGFPFEEFPPPAFALIPLIMCSTFLLAPPLLTWNAFSSAATMLEDLGVMASIKRGIQVIWKNIGTVIILLLVLLVGVFLISAVLSIVTMPLSFMAMLPMQQMLISCAPTEPNFNPIQIFECMQPALRSPIFIIFQALSALAGTITYVLQTLMFLIPISVFFNGIVNKAAVTSENLTQ